MYLKFYQLKENPFSLTADPSFFFSSRSHKEALSHLIYGIEQRKGISILTGEVGTGKSTLCKKLLSKANRKTLFILIMNLNFSDIELLQMIAFELGLRTKERDKLILIREIHKCLIKKAKKLNNIVIMVDEAHKLHYQQLETLCLLSNLETEKEKLLSIILVGQPELNKTIRLPELRQLQQRIAVQYHILSLEKTDLPYYIHHRISKAMCYANSIPSIQFTDEAIEAIYHHTKGSPRTINILCDRLLLAGYVNEQKVISHTLVNQCAKEILYCEHHT